MDARISMYVLLVWCSLDASGLLMVVTAEPTVSAVILTPEADRKEGGQVDMSCVATNLNSNYIVSWSTENPVMFLRSGGMTDTTESRFVFTTQEDTTTGITVQKFTIINVQREDSDEYFCKVNYSTPGQAYSVVASVSVTLSVLYFPSASFPVCSPAGPITVDNGTALNMSCTSESGHRAVRMLLNPTIHTARYTPWTSQIIVDTDTLIRTSYLPAGVAANCIAFECTITSTNFPYMERCCTIGPITINCFTAELTTSGIPCAAFVCSISSTSGTEHQTTSTESITTSVSNTQPSVTPSTPINNTSMLAPSPSSPAVIAGAVAGGVAALLLILILILICSKRRLGNSDTKSARSNLDTNQTNTELTLRLDNSQVSLNEYGEICTRQEEIQNNNHLLYTSTQHHDAYAFGTMPVQRAQATDPSLIYAKPLNKQTHTTFHEAMGRQPDQSFKTTIKQSYSNPVFVSDVSNITTRLSSDGFSSSLKPMATVKPTQSSQSKPSVPKPYQPKSAQRKSNPLSHHDNQMDPSQTPLASTSIHTDASTSNREEAHPSPNNPTYAQVSPHNMQQSNDNPDHIVYAELDLQSDEIQDGGLPSPSSSDAVMYASVM